MCQKYYYTFNQLYVHNTLQTLINNYTEIQYKKQKHLQTNKKNQGKYIKKESKSFKAAFKSQIIWMASAYEDTICIRYSVSQVNHIELYEFSIINNVTEVTNLYWA